MIINLLLILELIIALRPFGGGAAKTTIGKCQGHYFILTPAIIIIKIKTTTTLVDLPSTEKQKACCCKGSMKCSRSRCHCTHFEANPFQPDKCKNCLHPHTEQVAPSPPSKRGATTVVVLSNKLKSDRKRDKKERDSVTLVSGNGSSSGDSGSSGESSGGSGNFAPTTTITATKTSTSTSSEHAPIENQRLSTSLTPQTIASAALDDLTSALKSKKERAREEKRRKEEEKKKKREEEKRRKEEEKRYTTLTLPLSLFCGASAPLFDLALCSVPPPSPRVQT